jgi:hypothetical protein
MNLHPRPVEAAASEFTGGAKIVAILAALAVLWMLYQGYLPFLWS